MDESKKIDPYRDTEWITDFDKVTPRQWYDYAYRCYRYSHGSRMHNWMTGLVSKPTKAAKKSYDVKWKYAIGWNNQKRLFRFSSLRAERYPEFAKRKFYCKGDIAES